VLDGSTFRVLHSFALARITGAAAAASAGAGEVVRRPDPGIARGMWEAPSWALWLVMAAAIVGAGVYAAARAGVFRRARRPMERGGGS